MKVFTHSILFFSFLMNSSISFADADSVIAAQQTACSANSAKRWDSEKNRCVDQIETGTYRKDSISCNDITDIEQRKACQLSLASTKSGVSSDAEAALSGANSNASRSTIINTASAVISLISMFSSGGKESNCTSSKILAATSIAGTITDILMKIKIKKKAEEISKKYSIDKTNNAYQAQYKALQYLKELEENVKEIAETEKKRQTLLMIGYGSAFAMGMYESFTMNATCTKTNEQEAKDKAAAEKAKTEAAEKAKAEAAEKAKVKPVAAVAADNKDVASTGAVTTPVKDGKVETQELVANNSGKTETTPAEVVKKEPTTVAKSYEQKDPNTGKYYHSTEYTTTDVEGNITKTRTVTYNGVEYTDVKQNSAGMWVTGGKTVKTAQFDYNNASFYDSTGTTKVNSVYKGPKK